MLSFLTPYACMSLATCLLRLSQRHALAESLLSGLAWRGIDTLMRTREQTQAQVNRIASVQTTLAQWRSDLDALQPVMDATSQILGGRMLKFGVQLDF